MAEKVKKVPSRCGCRPEFRHTVAVCRGRDWPGVWRNGGGVAGADPLPDKALKERFCRSAAGYKARWEGATS